MVSDGTRSRRATIGWSYEPCATATSGCEGPHHRHQVVDPGAERVGLSPQRGTGSRAHRHRAVVEPLRQVDRLREMPCGDQYLVSAGGQVPGDRREEQRMRRVREIHPDPHVRSSVTRRSAITTAPAGPIGLTLRATRAASTDGTDGRPRDAERQRVIRDRMVYKTVLSLITIGVSGLIRLVFSVLVARVFGTSVLGHVNVVISTAVFATLLCSPGIGQAVARHLARRGLDGTAAQPAAMILTRATLVAPRDLPGPCGAGRIPDLRPTGGPTGLLASGLTFGYGAYTYYKAVLYGVDLVKRYAVLELSWDGLFLLALIAVVATDAERWVLAPLVLVYLGFLGRRPPDPVPEAHRKGAVDRVDAERAARAWSERVAVDGLVRSGDRGRDGVERRVPAVVPGVRAARRRRAGRVVRRRDGPGHAGLSAAEGDLRCVVPGHGPGRGARGPRCAMQRQLVVGTQILAAAMLPVFALVGMVATAAAHARLQHRRSHPRARPSS